MKQKLWIAPGNASLRQEIDSISQGVGDYILTHLDNNAYPQEDIVEPALEWVLPFAREAVKNQLLRERNMKEV